MIKNVICVLCVTCVRGRHALGEHAVSDDVEHAEGEHHGNDGDAKMKHILHVGLQKEKEVFHTSCE